MELKKSKTYEILDIINWSEAGELNINPKYQRNPVWDNTAKSFLIDTSVKPREKLLMGNSEQGL